MIKKTYKNVPKEYVDAVNNLFNIKKNERFMNDSCAHAELLADLIIGQTSSQAEALIYSGELPISCYKSAIEQTKATKIKILLDNLDENKFTVFGDKLLNKIEFRQKKESIKGMNHFFVCGDAYRYEKDHNVGTAISNFNEPSMVKKLTESFNKMWEWSAD
jgi:hypothetical protein